MSALNKWSEMDGRTTAHWWLGGEGTACGLDFVRYIRLAYDNDPRCQTCAKYLTDNGIEAHA